MVKMEELRKTFEALGFENVASYINSGNLAFDSKKIAESSLVSKIEAAIASDFGKVIPVMVREQSEIERILSANPFEGQYGSHKEMHVLFLKEEMPPEKRQQLAHAASAPERYEVHGREIFCHLPFGVADSLIGKNFIEKKLKISATGRNWRTVEKLSEL